MKKEYLVINNQFIKKISPFEWIINKNNVSAIKIPASNHMKEAILLMIFMYKLQ